MNRQQALAWLVENVTKWPVRPGLTKAPYGWLWIKKSNSDVYMTDCCNHEIITKQEWLDATDTL